MTAPDSVDDLLALLHEDWAAGRMRSLHGQDGRRLCDTEYDQRPATEHPYWDLVRLLPLDLEENRLWYSGHAIEVEWFHVPRQARREALTKRYAWSIPTPHDLTWLAAQLDGQAVVEVGAGTGYWAWQLQQTGVDVAAYDLHADEKNHYCDPITYHPVLRGTAEIAAVYPDRALLLCWPPYNTSMAAEALRAYEGDTVVYVGEPGGGCTADDEFHETLEKEWHEVSRAPRHVTWWGIHDYVTLWRRGPEDAESD